MAKVTPAEAEEYLREVGQWHVPVMNDDEWVKVLGFLYAGGFIADADYSTGIGQTILTIVADVNAEYEQWKIDNAVEIPEP
jgi:hypothetical protein